MGRVRGAGDAFGRFAFFGGESSWQYGRDGADEPKRIGHAQELVFFSGSAVSDVFYRSDECQVRHKDTIALSGATESFMVLVRDSMLAVALLAVPFWHNWQLILMTVFLVPASPFVLRSISLRRRLIVNASQDNVGAMHSRVEESYGVQKLVKAACSCDRDGRHFAPVKAALARLARGKTTVTTIADTDWIVVLDNGVVHEQGTQAELLVRPSGLFHQLYKLQTAGRTHP